LCSEDNRSLTASFSSPTLARTVGTTARTGHEAAMRRPEGRSAVARPDARCIGSRAGLLFAGGRIPDKEGSTK
jgi:hypothetical protein